MATSSQTQKTAEKCNQASSMLRISRKGEGLTLKNLEQFQLNQKLVSNSKANTSDVSFMVSLVQHL